MSSRRLKIGVMLDSTTVDRWFHDVLVEIAACDFLSLDCVILNCAEPPRRSFWARLRTFLPIVLFRIYQRLDRLLFREADDPLDPVDAAPLLERAARIETFPVGRRWVQRFKREDLDAIRARDLDVILRFGFRILRGKILESARYGVWSYHHGDNREYRGGPPLFWEIYDDNPRSGAILQVLTEELDGGKVLYRSVGQTRRTSLHVNRKPTYRKSVSFATRRLRDLYERGFDFLTSLDTWNEELAYNRGIQRTPTNRQMVVFLMRLAWRIVRNRWLLWGFHDRWFVAFQRRLPGGDWGSWERLEAPPGRYYADPFPVDVEGGTWLFVEACTLGRRDGVIARLWVGADGSVGEPRVVLEGEDHLSYPFVFESEGSWYMIPETAERRRIELYRAVEFPDRWKLEKVLLDDVRAVDSTLLAHDGRFWLFAAMGERPGTPNDELFLFHADSLLGEWVPHPQNPVVSDVRRARPAGRLERSAGAWIRPAQDGSREYGWAITLSRIETLNPDAYREVPVGRIDPDWLPGIRLTHTTHETPRLRVRDARARRLRFLRS